MSLFTYAATAPVASVSLRLADGVIRDVALFPGAQVELPPAHGYVQRLVARGLLTAVPAAPARGAKTPTPIPSPPTE